MIVVDTAIVSDDVARIRFACDLPQCFGACCVQGDAGAPLEDEEIDLLEQYFEEIKPFMISEGIKAVEDNGVFDYDEKGNFVTTLINGQACAFACFEDNIARCAIEKAFDEKRISFHKPVSCHLYPICIQRYKNFDGVNYHRWYICAKAIANGKKNGIYLYQFLRDALIRKYGEKWYSDLIEQIEGDGTE